MITCDVEMTINRNSYRIGEMYTIIIPSLTRFSDYHNKRAVLMEASDNIKTGTCTMKLLGLA